MNSFPIKKFITIKNSYTFSTNVTLLTIIQSIVRTLKCIYLVCDCTNKGMVIYIIPALLHLQKTKKIDPNSFAKGKALQKEYRQLGYTVHGIRNSAISTMTRRNLIKMEKRCSRKLFTKLPKVHTSWFSRGESAKIKPCKTLNDILLCFSFHFSSISPRSHLDGRI